ncbi:MAG: cytochrome C oxidase subunit IV family protein [Bacteroidota bacterium]
MDSTEHTIDIKKHVRTYIVVFMTLLALTIITVTVSYLHLKTVPAIFVALTIAAIKGSLVACYFMHLISEKKLIYAALILTAILFVVLMSLPLFSHANSIFLNHVS